MSTPAVMMSVVARPVMITFQHTCAVIRSRMDYLRGAHNTSR